MPLKKSRPSNDDRQLIETVKAGGVADFETLVVKAGSPINPRERNDDE
jgi:hypothetical protein